MQIYGCEAYSFTAAQKSISHPMTTMYHRLSEDETTRSPGERTGVESDSGDAKELKTRVMRSVSNKLAVMNNRPLQTASNLSILANLLSHTHGQ